MAITCLDNYIGLRGTCDGATPVSGRYINDLPGVDLKMLSNLSSEEQRDYEGVWNEIYRRSVNELVGDVMVRMQKYFRKSQILENRQVGYYSSPAVTEAASAEYKGVALELYGTEYTTIFINEVGLYLSTDGSVTVKIFDYRTGLELDSLSFSGVEGNNYFQVNKEYYAYGQKAQIFICYDATATASQESKVYFPDDIKPTDLVMPRGAKISTASSVTENNLSFTADTYGLTVNYNVKCSMERMVCSVKDILIHALYYKLAEQLLLEREFSQRLNKYTLFNAERAKELKEHYADKYIQTLDASLNDLEPMADGLCVECEKERTYKYSLP
jgi:hypothetical protein